MSHTIVIHSDDGGIRWITHLGDERLGELHDPLTDAARILLARGYHPDDKLQLKHRGNTYVSLTASIGWAAEHRVADDGGKLEFKKLSNNERRDLPASERQP